MAEGYRRLFLRWEIIRGWIPAIVFAVLAVAIELFYFNFMVGRGLVDKQVAIPIGPWTVPLSIALCLSLGNAVVLLTLWMSVFESTAYVKAGPDRQIRRIVYPLRMVRVGTLVFIPFTFVLFLPYVIESGGFVAFVDSATGAVPFFRQSAIGFYNWAFGVSQLEDATRFLISQLTAAVVTVAIAAVQVWRVKGTRNMMLSLRRRR